MPRCWLLTDEAAGNRRIVLTEAGRALLPKARQIVREMEESRKLIADLQAEIGGTLQVATSHHVGLHRVSVRIGAHLEAAPHHGSGLEAHEAVRFCQLSAGLGLILERLSALVEHLVLRGVAQHQGAAGVELLLRVAQAGHDAAGLEWAGTDLAAQETCRSIVESEIIKFGYQIYGWRQVPVDVAALGEKANATRPEIEQIMIANTKGGTHSAFERDLYVIRRRVEKAVIAATDR